MILSLYFKQVYTSNTAYYEINTEWTPTDLYNNVGPLISRDFNIINFELLDTFTYFNGKPEEKPKMELNNNITLDQLYGNNIKFVAFYIRVI
jgi:hypothetical protein